MSRKVGVAMLLSSALILSGCGLEGENTKRESIEGYSEEFVDSLTEEEYDFFIELEEYEEDKIDTYKPRLDSIVGVLGEKYSGNYHHSYLYTASEDRDGNPSMLVILDFVIDKTGDGEQVFNDLVEDTIKLLQQQGVEYGELEIRGKVLDRGSGRITLDNSHTPFKGEGVSNYQGLALSYSYE